jgi:hypothetical protein
MPDVSLTAPLDPDIARRMQIAQMLQEQGQAAPEVMSYKGIAAPYSKLGGLAKVLQSYMGARMQRDAGSQAQRSQADRDKAMLASLGATPEQLAGLVQPVQDHSMGLLEAMRHPGQVLRHPIDTIKNVAGFGPMPAGFAPPPAPTGRPPAMPSAPVPGEAGLNFAPPPPAQPLMPTPGAVTQTPLAPLPPVGAVTPAASPYLQTLVKNESGGNPTARNPRSSAMGTAQFIDSTWLDTVSRHRPDIAQGKAPAEILALRADPQLSNEMALAYGADNAALLDQQGFEATNANVALAHRFGPGGASNLLSQSPNTPMASLVSAKVINANPDLRGKTVGQVVGRFNQQYGTAPFTAELPPPPPTQTAQAAPPVAGPVPPAAAPAPVAPPPVAAVQPAGPQAPAGPPAGQRVNPLNATPAEIQMISRLLASPATHAQGAALAQKVQERAAAPVPPQLKTQVVNGRLVSVDENHPELGMTVLPVPDELKDHIKSADELGIPGGGYYTVDANGKPTSVYQPPEGYTSSAGRMKPIEGGPAQNQLTQTLRNDATSKPAISNYLAAQLNYDKVVTASKIGSAAGDLALVYAYMKMLDPNAAVMHDDYANAQNTAGVPDRIRNVFNNIKNGETLSVTQRREMVEAAGQQFTTYQTNARPMYDFYTNIARSQGLDPTLVLPGFGTVYGTGAPGAATPRPAGASPAGAPPAGAPPAGAPFPDATGPSIRTPDGSTVTPLSGGK